MKRFLSAFILLFFFTQFSAQFDKEHWFAPMFDRTRIGTNHQSLYLSTNEINSFEVEIYNNNQLIAKVPISKGSPAKYDLLRDKIIATDKTHLFKPTSKGLYLKAPKAFYANLRFSVQNHAEMQTSKGSAALGNQFRVVLAPITANNSILNFMTSIIATQDETTVNVSDFDSNIKFSDGIPKSQFNITLNKGQSYIIEGLGNQVQNRNSAFIGAKITSTKPIVIANGNFNGQYAGDYRDSSDILMDQSVPEDKLGNAFILVKGGGANSYDSGTKSMERAVIVAIENGTPIYLNGNPTPVATLDAGQSYMTPPGSYNNQGSNHYNMYISTQLAGSTGTPKNIYVYQLLAGTDGDSSDANNKNGEATGGINFIPPLSCYLPSQIDEIGRIDENEYSLSAGGYGVSVPTKLNIITSVNANILVKRNGTVLQTINAADLHPVSGNTDWGTYSIENITGNISIESTNKMPLTAGISAGNKAIGYGGYFAGFSKIPLIERSTGDCIPLASLELPDGYAKYEWFNVDDPTTILTDPANPHIFKPKKPGTYRCRIFQGSCSPELTQPKKFENCATEITESICAAQTYNPSFKYNTGEPVASITITKQPTKGTAVVNGASFTYTPNPNITDDSDEIGYSISNASNTVTEHVKLSLKINQIIATNTTIGECSSTNSANFNLTKTNYTSEPNFQSIEYYKSKVGAENQIANEKISSPYTAVDGNIVYARIENTLGCHAVKEVTLKIMSAPDVKPENHTKLHCDEEDGKLDGNYQAILNDVIAGIMTNSAGFTINFFKSKPDAEAPTNALPQNTPYIFTPSNNKIWVRVESDCDLVIKEIELKIGNLIPDATGANATFKENVCNDVNAYDYLNKFTYETGVSATYYKSFADAQNDVDGKPITNPTMLGIADGLNTFYFRIWKTPTYCATIFKLELTRLSPPKPTFPGAPYKICDDHTSTYTLDAEAGYTSWEWYNDNDPSTMISNSRTIHVKPGKYFVIVKSASAPCPIKSEVVEIIGEPKPDLDSARLTKTFCDNDLDGKAEVTFSTEVTPTILINSSLFDDIKYYTNSAMTASSQITTDNWSFATDTEVWVKVKPKYCAEVSAKIILKVGGKIDLEKVLETITECGDLSGKYTVTNLDDYRTNFTNDSSLHITYHNSKSGAQKGNDVVSTADLTFTNTKTYYLRISSSTGLCPVLAKLTININRPEASTELKDESICSGTSIDLKVGSGFRSHVWYKAEDLNTPIGDQETYRASIGNYVVVLEAQNGCKYTQPVKVSQAESAKITAIIIDGTTVTVKAEGGIPPYEYALEGPSYYQGFSSKFVFADVSKPGVYTVSVKTSSNCAPTTATFSILKIQNTITPNGDGKNDYVDYSELKSKTDAKFIIIDRYGKKVYDSAEKKDYIWDGKLNGKPLPNDTYWYILEWTDLGAPSPTQQKSWILLKNN
ncbi:MAG: T9SS type B sorting domain-containing protein [Soonwooa sp.]